MVVFLCGCRVLTTSVRRLSNFLKAIAIGYVCTIVKILGRRKKKLTRVECFQSRVQAFVAFSTVVDGVGVDGLQGERAGVLDSRDPPEKQQMGFALKGPVLGHALVVSVVHVLLHADSNLVFAMREQLESSRLRDSRQAGHHPRPLEHALEIAEVAQRSGVDRKSLVGRAESLCLLFPREYITLFAPLGEAR